MIKFRRDPRSESRYPLISTYRGSSSVALSARRGRVLARYSELVFKIKYYIALLLMAAARAPQPFLSSIASRLLLIISELLLNDCSWSLSHPWNDYCNPTIWGALLLSSGLGSAAKSTPRAAYRGGDGALWARIAQNVKKPSLTVNVINFEFFGFKMSIWVPLSQKVMIHW